MSASKTNKNKLNPLNTSGFNLEHIVYILKVSTNSVELFSILKFILTNWLGQYCTTQYRSWNFFVRLGQFCLPQSGSLNLFATGWNNIYLYTKKVFSTTHKTEYYLPSSESDMIKCSIICSINCIENWWEA